jgi:hypothetical protein
LPKVITIVFGIAGGISCIFLLLLLLVGPRHVLPTPVAFLTSRTLLGGAFLDPRADPAAVLYRTVDNHHHQCRIPHTPDPQRRLTTARAVDDGRMSPFGGRGGFQGESIRRGRVRDESMW